MGGSMAWPKMKDGRHDQRIFSSRGQAGKEAPGLVAGGQLSIGSTLEQTQLAIS